MANTLLNGPGETPAQNVGPDGPGRYEAFGYRLAEDGTVEAKVFVVAVTHGAVLPSGWFDHPDKCNGPSALPPIEVSGNEVRVDGEVIAGLEASGAEAMAPRRGRPPGSKNKPRDAEPEA